MWSRHAGVPVGGLQYFCADTKSFLMAGTELAIRLSVKVGDMRHI